MAYPYNLYSVVIVDFLDPCPDQGLENVRNRTEMSLAGWNLNELDVHPIATSKYNRWCGADTFWGYNYGRKVGRITYIFKGDGEAQLNFGNCYTMGTAEVYLNKNKIGSVKTKENKEINFAYTTGDTLRIKEVGPGIFIIHALKISCDGKTSSIVH